MTIDRCTPAFVASIQPVVLVGGKSSRFGRDKLREPYPAGGPPLLQRPIDALRGVFGTRVKLVGGCHGDLLALADGVIRDDYPGVGPLGGIISALHAHAGAVFVLAGDMPGATGADVARVLAAAERDSEAWAVLATTDHPHPCFGLYRSGSLPTLRSRLEAGEYRLTDALPVGRVCLVPCSARAVANINRPTDLDM